MASVKTGPKIMTANRLRDGMIVYLGPKGWSEKITDATIAETPEDEGRLNAIAQSDVKDRVVVGAYLAQVKKTDSGPQPLSERERIRATGPSVRPVGYTDTRNV
jgi:hypothetical protein